jgi:hypothetical protein
MMMHDDEVSAAMFWTGVMFVFTPLILAGIVIGTLWWQKKKAQLRSPKPNE